ncbi:unnamed protein product [Toxocara canis]|nr:unnamed protein product [Toxocara canis]
MLLMLLSPNLARSGLSYSLVTLRNAPAPLLRQIRAIVSGSGLPVKKPWDGYYMPKQPISGLSPWLTLEENEPFFV